jgi:hypothetical protein
MYFIAHGDGDVSDVFFTVKGMDDVLDLSGDCCYDSVVVFNSGGAQIASLYKQYDSPVSLSINNRYENLLVEQQEACSEISRLMNLREIYS